MPLKGPILAGKSIEDILKNLDMSNTAQCVTMAVDFTTTRFFWEIMSPNGGSKPIRRTSPMLLTEAFGSFDEFQRINSAVRLVLASDLAGLGYVYTKVEKLEVCSAPRTKTTH